MQKPQQGLFGFTERQARSNKGTFLSSLGSSEKLLKTSSKRTTLLKMENQSISYFIGLGHISIEMRVK